MNLTRLRPFQHVKWRPDRAELRRFAVAMLVGFALLGGLAAWRAGDLLAARPLVLWGAGLTLAAAALVPGLGRLAYLGVYLPTSLIGYIVSHVLMILIFFLVFLPTGLALRLMRKDVLRLRPPRGRRAAWAEIETGGEARRYYSQF